MNAESIIQLVGYLLLLLIIIAVNYVIKHPREALHHLKIAANRVHLLWLYFRKPK